MRDKKRQSKAQIKIEDYYKTKATPFNHELIDFSLSNRDTEALSEAPNQLTEFKKNPKSGQNKTKRGVSLSTRSAGNIKVSKRAKRSKTLEKRFKTNESTMM